MAATATIRPRVEMVWERDASAHLLFLRGRSTATVKSLGGCAWVWETDRSSRVAPVSSLSFFPAYASADEAKAACAMYVVMQLSRIGGD